ncbi:MAG: hypothetical protein HOQ05_02570 [Corynebacteriales bacterium]|nr:hypothetical protein [Mycobacteriales bacterium]
MLLDGTTVQDSVVDGLIALAFKYVADKDPDDSHRLLSPDEQLRRILADKRQVLKALLGPVKSYEYYRQGPAVLALKDGEIRDTSLALFRDWNPQISAPTEWLHKYRSRREVLERAHRIMESAEAIADENAEKELFQKLYDRSWKTARQLHHHYLARLSAAGYGPETKLWHTIKGGMYAATMTHFFYPEYQQIVDRIRGIDWENPDRENLEFITKTTGRLRRRYAAIADYELGPGEGKAGDYVQLEPVCVINSENTSAGHLGTLMPARKVCCFAFQGSAGNAACCINCGPELTPAKAGTKMNATRLAVIGGNLRDSGLQLCRH